MTAYSRDVDISVGYHETITMDAAYSDYTGWTFEATFAAFVDDPGGIALGMAADLSHDGWYIVDGPTRQVSLKILPATLQAYPNSTGSFQLISNVLATPPAGERMKIFDLILNVEKGPTP